MPDFDNPFFEEMLAQPIARPVINGDNVLVRKPPEMFMNVAQGLEPRRGARVIPKVVILDEVSNPCQLQPPQSYTLTQAIGLKTKGTFGIEIETEGTNLLKAISGKWTDKADGSLRGESREYILRKPLALEDAKKALVDLNTALSANKAVLDFSFRTSVHVHVNVLEFTKHQIHTFLYLSYLLENALTRFGGDSRSGNRFCLRCCDAEYQLEAAYDFLLKRGFNGIREDSYKYCAINLCPMMTQGSIEFRAMRGTLDIAVLFPWLDVLQNIRNISQKYSIHVIKQMALTSPLLLATEVFGPHLPLFSYTEMEQEMRAAYSMLISMPYLEVKE
jgi:hypothetical protein